MHIIKHIQQQANYHTIVVMRTKEEELANQFNHTIFTFKNQIVYTPTQNGKEYQFNMDVDAFKVRVGGRAVVLADFEAIRGIFDQNKLQSNSKIVFFQQLGFKNNLQFYLYLNKGQFLVVHPLAIISKTIIFLFNQKDQSNLPPQQFKHLDFSTTSKQKSNSQTCYFSCQFALLSDQHFMNNLVRGYRQYSHYLRNGNDYTHAMDEGLVKSLTHLFPTAKL